METLLRKHGKGVVQKEYQQERLANTAIDLYACLATLSRATAAISRLGEEKAASQIRIARSFVHDARHRLVGNLKKLERNRDDDSTAISDAAYEKAGYGFDYWE